MSNKLSWILLDVFVNFIYQSINRKHFSCLYYRKESWQNQFFRSVSVFWLLGCYGPSSILMGGNFFRYPKLYDLSKIHKEGAPLRPIMSSIYHTEISWIWSKLHVTVHTSYVKNLEYFINIIKKRTLHPEYILVSFDTVSLSNRRNSSNYTEEI